MYERIVLNFSNLDNTGKPVALVTGGTQRLGRYITESLQPTHRVVAHFFESVDEAISLTSHVNDIISLKADLTMPSAPAKLITRTIEEAGQLDLLVNNAAIFCSDNENIVNLAKMKTLNVDAPIRLIAEARPHLSKSGGQIINIADIAAIRNFGNYMAYSKSKAALLDYAATHALSLARDQIRINTICPGLVMPSSSQRDAGTLRSLRQQIPLHQTGKPEDVADLVSFLASSNFITGQVIAVDGGRLLNYAHAE